MRKASLFKFSITSLAVVLVSALLFGALQISSPGAPGVVSAVTYPELYPNYGVATIDGQIHDLEWAAADSVPFTTEGPTAIAGTFYVMQSQTDLYLGVKLLDDEFNQEYWYGLYGDTIFFDFDDDNSGELYDIGENRFISYAYAPWYRDDYFYKNDDGGYSYADTSADPPGVNNGNGCAARHDDTNHYEVSFPLCSGDVYDFCLHPGDVVGLRVKYYDVYNDGELQAVVGFFPGQNLYSLVKIHISDFNLLYLPLILK